MIESSDALGKTETSKEEQHSVMPGTVSNTFLPTHYQENPYEDRSSKSSQSQQREERKREYTSLNDKIAEKLSKIASKRIKIVLTETFKRGRLLTV